MIKNIFKNKMLKRLVALTCAGIMTLSLTACGSESSGGNSVLIKSGKYAVVKSVNPKLAACPIEPVVSFNPGKKDLEKIDQYEEKRREWNRAVAALSYNGSTDNLVDYWVESINTMLNDTKTENRAYSPINLYFALGMLSELTDGESRKQVLDALGYDNIDDLRDQANNIWNSCYLGDGSTALLLGNSLWLDDQIDYKKETLDRIANTYYASSFSGQMGSVGYTKEFRNWINENTKDLLKDSVEKLELDPDTVLALASTIYYKAAWEENFSESATKKDTFKGADGDTECLFMQGTEDTVYYKGENYQLAAKRMKNNAGYAWFVLPDEDASLEEVLNSGDALRHILNNKENSDEKVIFKLPKFDVAAEINLVDKLKELGITDVFDMDVADFSPMLEDSDRVYVSDAKQSVRITADEEGALAAAYTVMIMKYGACPAMREPIEFTLDRPFFFMLSSRDNFPLFTASINSMK